MDKFLQAACDEARKGLQEGGIPIGSVIVHDGKIIGRASPGVFRREPGDSIQIGADMYQPVGDYVTPNHFSGIIENLTFKYPNGT